MIMRSDSWVVRIWKLAYPLLIHFAVSMLVSLIFSVIMLLGSSGEELTEADVLRLSLPMSLAIDVLVLPVLFWFFRRDSHRLIPVKMKTTPLHWIVLVLCGASACLAANFLISLSGLVWLFYDQYQEVSSLLYSGGIWMELILMAIFAPCVEELLFRGLIFRRLRTYCTFPVALVVSALLFGVYHGNVVQGVYAFLLGMAMAFVYERFRTIWAPIVFHGSANLISVVVTEIPQISNWLDAHVFSVMLITIALALGTLYLIQFNLRPKEEQG